MEGAMNYRAASWWMMLRFWSTRRLHSRREVRGSPCGVPRCCTAGTQTGEHEHGGDERHSVRYRVRRRIEQACARYPGGQQAVAAESLF